MRSSFPSVARERAEGRIARSRISSPVRGPGNTLPVALLAFTGHWLDRWLGTSPWLMLAGLLLGMGVGFYNLWRRVAAPRTPPRAGGGGSSGEAT